MQQQQPQQQTQQPIKRSGSSAVPRKTKSVAEKKPAQPVVPATTTDAVCKLVSGYVKQDDRIKKVEAMLSKARKQRDALRQRIIVTLEASNSKTFRLKNRGIQLNLKYRPKKGPKLNKKQAIVALESWLRQKANMSDGTPAAAELYSLVCEPSQTAAGVRKVLSRLNEKPKGEKEKSRVIEIDMHEDDADSGSSDDDDDDSEEDSE
jgi:hypothetical protein